VRHLICLERNTFAEDMTGHIPNGLLNIISDFLTNRSFYANVKSANSSIYSLDRGCPQGPVLGPVLFNLYVSRNYTHIPPNVKFIAYADDSYVICPGSTVDEAKTLAESTIAIHVEKLHELGMVVNEGKTGNCVLESI